MADEEKVDINGDEYTKALANAPIFQKTATVQARPAQAGEIIVTTLADGTEETTNTTYDGDFIITNPDGERYIIRRDNFAKNYEPTDRQDIYKAKDLIRAVKNPTGHPITIIAPWGKEMNGDEECYIATGYDPANPDVTGAGRYIIGDQEFTDTYSILYS